MKSKLFRFYFPLLVIALCFITLIINKTFAQFPNLPSNFKVDTANKELIRLIFSEKGTFFIEKETTTNVLVGMVEFEHKGDRLYADSARLNVTKNVVHAYGNVSIIQTDGTVAYADRMYYDGKTKIVELLGNVELNSGTDYLWSKKIIYNLQTQIGKYTESGTLQTGSTVIESKQAVYNGKSKDARFTGDVNVLDPEYEVVSSDLNYNTESRIVTFYGPSIINNDSSTLYTTSGTYDSEREIAIFRNRSSIQSEGQYMESDSMYYDRFTGLGMGIGNVVIIDSTRDTKIWSDQATVNEKTKQILAFGNPYMEMAKDQDTTYISADTFFSEPAKYLNRPKIPLTAEDSLLYELDLLKRAAEDGLLLDTNLVDSFNQIYELYGDLDSLEIDTLITPEILDSTYLNINALDSVNLKTVLYNDTLNLQNNYRPINTDNEVKQNERLISNPSSVPKANTQIFSNDKEDKEDEPRYFTAYRNVVVYNDSFQAKADSLIYSQVDSIMEFYKSPVLWSRNAQITGEVIRALVDTNNIKWVHIPRTGIIANQSTDANEIMLDQIQGNVIWAYFTKNEMDSIVAIGNAETIYYIKDEEEAYIGVSEANGAKLNINFYTNSLNERTIRNIKYYNEVSQKMIPIESSDPETLKLSRLKWRKSEKIPNKMSFFDLIEKRKKEITLKEKIRTQLDPNKKD